MRYTGLKIAQDRYFAAAVDPTSFTRAVPIEVTSGTIAGLRRDYVVVEDKTATKLHLRVGSHLDAQLGGQPTALTVAGIYRSMEALSVPMLMSLDTATAAGVPAQDSLAFVLRQKGANSKAVEAGIDHVIAGLPTVTLKDQNAFAAEQRQPIDQLLYMIYALLGLAVIIAVLGIINTLALSVIERTREIGLLRAVGLSRRQLRTMLRLESVAIALLGAVLGVVLGLGAGWTLQRSLADDGIDVLSIPIAQLAIFVVLAGVVGVLAALWPGRRAARLDVLRAITTE
jgi:putative ABC transport system permease protein